MAKNVEIIAREVVSRKLAKATVVAETLKAGKILPYMSAWDWKKYGYTVKAEAWDNPAFTVRLFNARIQKMANTRIFSKEQVEKANSQTETPKVTKEAEKIARKEEPKQTVKTEPKQTVKAQTNSAKKSWKTLEAEKIASGEWKPHANVMTVSKESKTETRKTEKKQTVKAEQSAPKTIKAKGKKAPRTKKAHVLKQNVYIENGVEIMHISQVNGANRVVKETTIPMSVYNSLSKKSRQALESMVMA